MLSRHIDAFIFLLSPYISIFVVHRGRQNIIDFSLPIHLTLYRYLHIWLQTYLSIMPSILRVYHVMLCPCDLRTKLINMSIVCPYGHMQCCFSPYTMFYKIRQFAFVSCLRYPNNVPEYIWPMVSGTWIPSLKNNHCLSKPNDFIPILNILFQENNCMIYRQVWPYRLAT